MKKNYKILNHYVRVKFDDCIEEGIALETRPGKEYRVYFPNGPVEWNIHTIARRRIIKIGPSVKIPRL